MTMEKVGEEDSKDDALRSSTPTPSYHESDLGSIKALPLTPRRRSLESESNDSDISIVVPDFPLQKPRTFKQALHDTSRRYSQPFPTIQGSQPLDGGLLAPLTRPPLHYKAGSFAEIRGRGIRYLTRGNSYEARGGHGISSSPELIPRSESLEITTPSAADSTADIV